MKPIILPELLDKGDSIEGIPWRQLFIWGEPGKAESELETAKVMLDEYIRSASVSQSILRYSSTVFLERRKVAILPYCRNPSWNGCLLCPWDCWILYTMLAAYDALLFCLNKEKESILVKGPLLTHFFCLPGHIRGTSCHRRDICCLPSSSSSPLQSLWLKSLRPDLCRFSCYWRKRYWRTEDFSEIIQRSHLSAPCVVFVD